MELFSAWVRISKCAYRYSSPPSENILFTTSLAFIAAMSHLAKYSVEALTIHFHDKRGIKPPQDIMEDTMGVQSPSSTL